MPNEPFRRFGEMLAPFEKPRERLHPEHWVIAGILAATFASAIYALI